MTGISLLLQEIYDLNIAWVIVVVNIPLIIMGAFQVSRAFAIRTFIAVIFLGLCLHYIPYHTITSDKLLVSIFGGVFMGIGVGMAIRGGCALDGIEVLALYTGKRISFTISELILGINIVIFLIAGIELGLQTALYSILTYYAASRTISFVIEGVEEYTGVTIISAESEKVKEALVMDLGRGITVYKGERGYLKQSFNISHPVDIVFTVVTRLEVRRLRNMVYGIDPNTEAIDYVRQLSATLAPNNPVSNFVVTAAEELPYPDKHFDLAICSAVLHFARSHAHFDAMLRSVWRVIKPGGYLFVRLASDIGIENLVVPLGDGVYLLPDGSTRYLVNQELLLRYTAELGAELFEPIKTTNVQNLRCMTTWCVSPLTACRLSFSGGARVNF